MQAPYGLPGRVLGPESPNVELGMWDVLGPLRGLHLPLPKNMCKTPHPVRSCGASLQSEAPYIHLLAYFTLKIIHKLHIRLNTGESVRCRIPSTDVGHQARNGILHLFRLAGF